MSNTGGIQGYKAQFVQDENGGGKIVYIPLQPQNLHIPMQHAQPVQQPIVQQPLQNILPQQQVNPVHIPNSVHLQQQQLMPAQIVVQNDTIKTVPCHKCGYDLPKHQAVLSHVVRTGYYGEWLRSLKDPCSGQGCQGWDCPVEGEVAILCIIVLLPFVLIFGFFWMILYGCCFCCYTCHGSQHEKYYKCAGKCRNKKKKGKLGCSIM